MTGIDPGTRAWHRPLHHTRAGELDPDTAQTKGMKRFEALSKRHGGTEQLWLGENHVGANMNSGDHHHGAAETGIYVVSGHPVFVFLEDGEERLEIRDVCTLTLSFDHRHVDGESGSRFLADVASIMEDPAAALLF